MDYVFVGDNDVIRERDGAPSWTGEGIELQHPGGHTIAYNSISRVLTHKIAKEIRLKNDALIVNLTSLR